MVYSYSKDLNVLYVEDDVEVRERTAEILREYFSTFDVAGDGLGAFKKYKKFYIDNMQYYDLVISNIDMPYLNGLELSDSIFDMNCEQAIIILSTNNDPMYLFELINLGISSFISKPIKLNQLNRTLYQVCRKISMRKKELERRKVEENERKFLQSVMDLQDNLIIITDGKQIVSANQSSLDFFNFQTVDDFQKNNVCISNIFIATEGYFHVGLLQEDELWIEHILQHQDNDFTVMMQNANTLKKESFKVTVNYFHGTKKYISTFSNITKMALKNKEDQYKAVHDSLTGIYNRYKLNDLLATHFTSIMETDAKHFAFILFDIDYFKEINDTYGHLIGDQVLIELTSVIKKNIRENDLFVRWGGDEFILVVENVSPEKAIKVAEHLCYSIEQNTFETIGQLTCSFGITLYQNADKLSQMISRADKALYNAKKSGRNTVAYI